MRQQHGSLNALVLKVLITACRLSYNSHGVFFTRLCPIANRYILARTDGHAVSCRPSLPVSQVQPVAV